MSRFNVKRKLGGHKSKRNGDDFEGRLTNAAFISGWHPIRIPNGGKLVRTHRGLIPILTKSPFDFVFLKNGVSVFIDAKSTGEKNFSYSMIDFNQVENLMFCHEKDHLAGYIVHYQLTDQVYFYPAKYLNSIQPRTSLVLGNGYFLGLSREVIDLDLLMSI